jgi:hypothetical protein
MEIPIDVLQNIFLYLPYFDYYRIRRFLISEKQRLEWIDCQTEIIETSIGVEYRVNGKLHRERDLPAIEWKNGTKFWYKNGEYHRDGDKEYVKWSSTEKWK